jgi:plasmid maintenance system antidote protein VapI
MKGDSSRQKKSRKTKSITPPTAPQNSSSTNVNQQQQQQELKSASQSAAASMNLTSNSSLRQNESSNTLTSSGSMAEMLNVQPSSDNDDSSGIKIEFGLSSSSLVDSTTSTSAEKTDSGEAGDTKDAQQIANEEGSIMAPISFEISSSSSLLTDTTTIETEYTTNNDADSKPAAKSDDEKQDAETGHQPAKELDTTITQEQDSDYVNPRGVRFVQDGPNGQNLANIPYGLPCVRELLRFLISLINHKNSDQMITMGLNLITVGLESGVDSIASYQSLLAYTKDDLCKNLYNLLSSERMPIYTSVLRALFLLFESLRGHLKLQLEHFFAKLMEIIQSESNKISSEQKEMTIDLVLQMLRIPGFAVEIYLNYDCSPNCTNLFEELTKLLSKVKRLNSKNNNRSINNDYYLNNLKFYIF